MRIKGKRTAQERPIVPKSRRNAMSAFSFLLNLLWILFGGLWMATGWVIAAILMAITVIGSRASHVKLRKPERFMGGAASVGTYNTGAPYKQLPLLRVALAVRKARATSSNAHLAETAKAA
jgi:hypothetical protein